MTKPGLEPRFNSNFGWVLVLLLVAGSSFLLGSSFNKKSGEQTTVGAEQPTAASASVIGDISSTLQNSTVSPTLNDNTPTPPTVTGLININTATVSELDTLPGIGPTYAQAIINYRTANGPFVRIEDIEKVKGIGPKTFEKLKSKITI